MATRTVEGGGDSDRICHDLGAVVVIMAVEVGAVAVNTGAAQAPVNRGVPITVGANDPGPIDVGVAGEAVVGMHRDDGVPAMAIHT